MAGQIRATAQPRLRAVGAEALAIALAAGIACLVLGVLASTARSWIMFSDGDSVLPALMVRSVEAGQRQDWILSSVLFLPELAQFLLLSLLGLGSRATMALNAVVNFTLLFVSIRMAAGALLPGRSRRARILVALGGFALVVLPAMTDTSSQRDTLELPSQLAMATYYSWTLLAIPATVALAVWSTRPSARHPGRPAIGALLGLALLTAVSTLSNPLHLVWTLAPLAVLLLFTAGLRRLRWRAVALPVAALVVGGVAGMLGRGAFSREIGLSGIGYLHFDRIAASAAYYGGLVAARADSGGLIELVIWIGGAALGIATAVRCLVGRRDGTVFATAALAGLVPLLLAVAVVCGGTDAARYLDPVWVLPALALIAAVAAWPQPGVVVDALAERAPLVRTRVAVLAVAVLAVATGVPGGILLGSGAARVDAGLACVVSWVDHSHRTGAGQYWTIRPAKALIDNPARLIQVTGDLRPYWWLVNRADYPGARVTFLVNGPEESFSPELTSGARRFVQCGGYQIADFGAAHPLPISSHPFT